MKIQIIDNIFVNNSAEIEGGAIKWSDEMPYFLNNTYINNSAIYGKNIASFPIRIILNVYNKTSQNKVNLSRIEAILWSINRTNIPLSDISSGNSIPYILQFELLDVYGKIVNLNEGLFLYFIFIFLKKIIFNLFDFYDKIYL